MKQSNKISSIPLALAATLIGKLVLPAQDWQTVDDFAPTGGNAEAHGVAVDAAGRIYVVGTANGDGIVRYSADDGLSWITLDDFAYPSEANTLFSAVTIDTNGTVFVGGMAAGAGYGVGHWLVRRSTDQGATWEAVDDFYQPMNGPDEPGTNGVVYSLACDNQGRVYGGGIMLLTGPSYPSWWIRGSLGSANWDTKLVAFGGYTEFFQIACAGADVYAAGSVNGDEPFVTGIILKSSDHGATWTTAFEGVGDVPSAITSSSAGYLYSAGTHWINSTSLVWQVRQAASDGTTWTTLDSSLYEEDPSVGAVDQPYASSIAVDTAGNVCATGQFIDYWAKPVPNGTMYGSDTTWFTRQYFAAAGQWRTTDLFSYSTNRQGAALGTAVAPSGSVFTVGYGISDSGQRRWVVRKQDPSTPVALARALEKEVNNLMARAAIAGQPASVLMTFLDGMVAEMERGKSASLCNRLSTFSKTVQRFVKQGTLAQSDGELLMNGADDLGLILGCRER